MKQLDATVSSQYSILPQHSTMSLDSLPPADTFNFQDGNHTKFLYHKLDSLGKILSFLTVLNLILNVFYIYLDVEGGYSKCGSLILDLMLWFNVIILALSVMVWVAEQELLRAQNMENPDYDPTFCLLKLKSIALEVFLIVLQPYSFLNDSTFTTFNTLHNFPFEFKINHVLTMLNSNKIFLVLRFILSRSVYHTCSASRVCKIYEANFGYLFVIKSWFKTDPIKLGATFLTINILVFSFCLHVCQGPMLLELPKHGYTYKNGLDQYITSLWFTFTTLTTAGYGDINTQTVIGRIITSILIILSTFVVSILVVVFTNELFTNLSEKRTISVINRLALKEKETLWAANTIAHHWRKKKVSTQLRSLKMGFHSKQKMRLDDKVKKKSAKLQNKLADYQNKTFIDKEVRKDLNGQRKEMTSVENEYDECARDFEDLIDEINEFMVSQKKCEEMVFEYILPNRQS